MYDSFHTFLLTCSHRLKAYICLVMFVAGVGILPGCSSKTELKDFFSDGCSMFPDRNLILEQDWCECCFDHDIAYWQGGTKAQRLAADTALKECVFEKTGDDVLAETVFNGVRVGGSPFFYNWYRWGYGWSFERKYGPLTDEEKKLVHEKLEKYFSENPDQMCR